MSESEEAANNARFHAARTEEQYWQERKEREYLAAASLTLESEREDLARDLFVSMFAGGSWPSSVEADGFASFVRWTAGICFDMAEAFQAERNERQRAAR